jgi:hypothetical protein
MVTQTATSKMALQNYSNFQAFAFVFIVLPLYIIGMAQPQLSLRETSSFYICKFSFNAISLFVE